MGLLKRILGGGESRSSVDSRPGWLRDGIEALLYEGDVMLEVKGESYHQPELRHIVGQLGREVIAILVPEPENQYDRNAVGVWVGGHKVGHLAREDAPRYQQAVVRLMRDRGNPVALRGRILGGERDRPSLGIWLLHDPADFGMPPSRSQPPKASTGGVLTGTAAAGLAWAEHLPSDRLAAIKQLRKLLKSERDSFERHFMYIELESLLYKCRDVFESATAEFEQTCREHDAEMDSIRPRLIAELGGIPSLPTYKQAAIMFQKARDFDKALWWAERGLALYGDEAIRVDAVEDLRKRASKYRTRLQVG